MGVGANIKKLRSRTLFSQRHLADELGVDLNTYANWENETNDIKSGFIPKLAQIFNVRINDLFEEKSLKTESILPEEGSKADAVDNSIVLVLPDKDAVAKLAKILKQNLDS